MAKRDTFKIVSNLKIAPDVFAMKLLGDTSAIKNPGEFVNISIPGKFLQRPISVSNWDDESLDIIYKVVGGGTEILSKMKENDELTLLTGLGNGFDLTVDTKKPVLIGGGLGEAPLYKLAIELKKLGKSPKIIIGFRTEEDVFFFKEFVKLFPTYITVDSRGELVTDILQNLGPDGYDYFYACGPKPMLKAICDMALTDGEVSMETRMACGIGQCKCCSIETNDGMKTLCKDGPVLKKGQVRW